MLNTMFYNPLLKGLSAVMKYRSLTNNPVFCMAGLLDVQCKGFAILPKGQSLRHRIHGTGIFKYTYTNLP